MPRETVQRDCPERLESSLKDVAVSKHGVDIRAVLQSALENHQRELQWHTALFAVGRARTSENGSDKFRSRSEEYPCSRHPIQAVRMTPPSQRQSEPSTVLGKVRVSKAKLRRRTTQKRSPRLAHARSSQDSVVVPQASKGREPIRQLTKREMPL